MSGSARSPGGVPAQHRAASSAVPRPPAQRRRTAPGAHRTEDAEARRRRGYGHGAALRGHRVVRLFGHHTPHPFQHRARQHRERPRRRLQPHLAPASPISTGKSGSRPMYGSRDLPTASTTSTAASARGRWRAGPVRRAGSRTRLRAGRRAGAQGTAHGAGCGGLPAGPVGSSRPPSRSLGDMGGPGVAHRGRADQLHQLRGQRPDRGEPHGQPVRLGREGAPEVRDQFLRAAFRQAAGADRCPSSNAVSSSRGTPGRVSRPAHWRSAEAVGCSTAAREARPPPGRARH